VQAATIIVFRYQRLYWIFVGGLPSLKLATSPFRSCVKFSSVESRGIRLAPPSVWSALNAAETI
jgi:hypothetical protein